MNGLEAKYTAKHLAKLIKRNRAMEKKVRRQSDRGYGDEAYNSFIVAHHVANENRKMSQEFRAFMIHNAFRKNRKFTSAEVMYYNPVGTVNDLVTYSQYVDKFQRQQKAIQIVRHQLLSSDERQSFEDWLSVETGS
jgi:hypothetical protein